MIKKVLVFIVCYNDENFISQVIHRIPDEIWHNDSFETDCLIIDDHSSDQTFQKTLRCISQWCDRKITLLHNPENQGYGGNQKIGYFFAIENQFDVVLLLHGDGQYPPEMIGELVTPIIRGEADAVFGSRMMDKKQALKGGMPIYKWIANQCLTSLQNLILGAHLTEFHTGFRAYSVPVLAQLPFVNNSNDFDFDTDIIIQLLDNGKQIREISIPTYYGKTISRVNGIKYGISILSTTLLSRVVPRGIYYHPKFDYSTDENSHYTLKLGYKSSHQFALDRVRSNSVVLDLSCGPGLMAQELARKQIKTISIVRKITPSAERYSAKVIEADIEKFDFHSDPLKVDYVLLLDLIEHLKSPEKFFLNLRDRFGNDRPEFIITTGNIAFIVMRLSLLLGQFNYGKRGILDLDHSRLFTYYSLRRILMNCGYEILLEQGIPAPFPLALGNNFIGNLLLKINTLLIYLSKNLFAYQMVLVAKPNPTLKHLLANAQSSSQTLSGKIDSSR